MGVQVLWQEDVARYLPAVLSAAVLLLLLRSEAARSRRADRAEELRREMEERHRTLTERNGLHLAELEQALARQLHASVEGQMQSSFARVAEQFSAVQRAVGEVQTAAAGLADLRRLFGHVRARGAWGEAQLRALLDDILPAGAYDTNVRVRPDQTEIVEFAVRMPSGGAREGARKLLAIDSKFPTEAYERLLAAEEAGDAVALRAARSALETALRAEARRISTKYIAPPTTVDYAVLYLPTDGLYVEASRIPGLIDELGRSFRVVVMGPAVLPGMLRSIHLGYMTLALGERAEAVGRLLGATRQEIRSLDATLDKLARNVNLAATTIEEARRRTRVIVRRLGSVEEAGDDEEEAELPAK